MPIKYKKTKPKSAPKRQVGKKKKRKASSLTRKRSR